MGQPLNDTGVTPWLRGGPNLVDVQGSNIRDASGLSEDYLQRSSRPPSNGLVILEEISGTPKIGMHGSERLDRASHFPRHIRTPASNLISRHYAK